MALLRIGIVENVSFGKGTGFDEDGNRVIVMQIKPSKEELVQAMMEGTVIEPAQSNFRIFDPNMKDFNNRVKSSTELVGEYLKLQSSFIEYGKLLAPEEDVKAAFGGIQPMIKLGIDAEGLQGAIDRFTDEGFIKKVYDSLFSLFAEFVNGIENLEEIKFRHKFWRASKNKAFASIPSPAGAPYVESMQIPVEASEIAWSVWELENEKNSDKEVAADKPADTKNVEAEDMFAPPSQAAEQPDLLDYKEQ